MKEKKIITSINNKYNSQGENPHTYLSGLMHSKPINYWEYCEVETLLTLQKSRTNLDDEMIFIMYHQINELIFKMILSEIEQICFKNESEEFYEKKINRILRYFDILISSFSIMKDGMDVNQYMKFRDALTPASGFQSSQYRKIELSLTNIENLIDVRFRKNNFSSVKQKFDCLYWQSVGKDFKNGKTNVMLKEFLNKYESILIEFTLKYEKKNFNYKFLKSKSKIIKELLRKLDFKINIEWPLTHYKTAEHYLENPKFFESTGGSKWKKYMHPQYQKRIFFPSFWSEIEKKNWGLNTKYNG
ncbi:MAG: tryptophan 2,3-dioxygenase [Flavobacteriales bacterium]|nr:tryptophan 2,3-dioxygenase [Flavobacteriales bacterium]|tara:strand:+ start:260 stop:1165 length:906 start_codon:yes stop_codon:yes gene_type:complete